MSQDPADLGGPAPDLSAPIPDLAEPGPVPILRLVEPSRVSSGGGATLVLTGDGFVPGATVRIAGTPALRVAVEPPGRLTAVLPPLSGVQGPVPVVVETPGGVVSRSDLLSLSSDRLLFEGPMALPAVSIDIPRFPVSALGDVNEDGLPDVMSSTRVGLARGDGTYRFLSFRAGAAVERGTVVQDLNGDNKLDIAQLSATCLNVYLGQGDGTFQAARCSPVTGIGLGASQQLFRDLTGDGKVDAVVLGSGAISVLEGKGDGTFEAPVSVGAAAGPSSFALGLIDGDAQLDLAIAYPGTNKIGVHFGNGDGTFQAPRDLAGSAPLSLALADLDGDGRADLVATRPGQVAAYLGNGDGTFQAARTRAAGSLVGLRDLDGDGRLDLITNTGVLPGNGDGTFQIGQALPAGAGRVALAEDFDGDGKPDLLLGDGFRSVVLRGRGDGSFQASRPFTALPGTSVAAADLDGDGRPEALLQRGSGVEVFRAGPGGGLLPAASLPLGGQSLALADLNGDGRPDLLRTTGAALFTSLGNGDGTFQAARSFSVPAYSLTTGDLDGDGKLDVVTSGRYAAAYLGGRVLLGQGNGDVVLPPLVNLPNDIMGPVQIGDLNGDGRLDLAMVDMGTLYVYLGQGNGTFQSPPRTILPAVGSGSLSGVALGDVNGDRRLDLLVIRYDLVVNLAQLYVGDGAGGFSAASTPLLGSYGGGSVYVAARDLNGDGLTDFAVLNQCDAMINVLRSNGDGTFQNVLYALSDVATDGLCDGVRDLAFADVNGDNKPDLLTSSGHLILNLSR